MVISLQFPLHVEDDWPPVGSESLPFRKVRDGYELLTPPLFVYNLSVGDVINILEDGNGFVVEWSHLSKSARSVIWLLRLSEKAGIDIYLDELRQIGCNTTGISDFGCYSIDVPESVTIADVDAVLNNIDTMAIAVAFPSLRHTD
jgi:hypothetical protein